MIQQDPIFKAAFEDVLVCNPNPFLHKLIDLVRDHGTDVMKTNEAKSVLYNLNQMAYGEMSIIDMEKEWMRLKIEISKMEKEWMRLKIEISKTDTQE
jgi:hypothetical protein